MSRLALVRPGWSADVWAEMLRFRNAPEQQANPVGPGVRVFEAAKGFRRRHVKRYTEAALDAGLEVEVIADRLRAPFWVVKARFPGVTHPPFSADGRARRALFA
jgi:hypothetical protein